MLYTKLGNRTQRNTKMNYSDKNLVLTLLLSDIQIKQRGEIQRELIINQMMNMRGPF